MTYYLIKDGNRIEATEEQQAIIEAANSSTENLLINALAGSAKTTTIEFLCKYMSFQMALSLAFNKRIATEMAERLPSHVLSKTVNSVGHNCWGATIGKKFLKPNEKKSYQLLKELTEELKGDDRSEAWSYFADILKAVGMAKSLGYVPLEGVPGHAKRLISPEDFFSNFEEGFPTGLVDIVLRRSIIAAYQGGIDYDDQIYMPTLFGAAFPRFPVVFVDEAQDLSPINHQMLKGLAPGRLIAVGDPWQSIYAFRGADTASMPKLRDHFKMREMTLSVSFRCPVEIVKNAHFRVPHMKWAPGAPDGEIHALTSWTAAEIPDGSAIICRNNAPLFRCALELIKAGRGVNLVGRDVGPGLIKVLKKLGPETMNQSEVLNAIKKWEEARISASKDPGTTADRADCLRVFASYGPTLRAAIHYAEHIFRCDGPIQLLSGHKAKGLEWDTVYHLDPWRIPSKWSEDLEQELNVRYVIETRAKRSLYLVTMETFNVPQ